jgi:NADP-dependent 3-hydroxy acid dehydrogenase YdfG
MHTTPKVALVTGASSGFGLATAARLSAQGFRMFGTSRAPAHNEASSVELLPLDVTSETTVQTCVQTILERSGRIDLLMNNAGFAQAGALEETSLEEARAQFDTNVFGVLRMLKAVLPVMREQGSGQMITVSSFLGVLAMPYLGLYASSKFAACGHDRGTLPRTASFSHHGVSGRAHLFSHELRRAASGDTTGCV